MPPVAEMDWFANAAPRLTKSGPGHKPAKPPTCAKNGTTEDEFGVDVSWIRAIKFVSESGSVALFFDEHDAWDYRGQSGAHEDG